MKLDICGRWPLDIIPGVGGHYAYLNTTSSHNPDCFLRLIQGMPFGLRVREYFGGVGIFSTIIQRVLMPRMHVVTDLDPDCVAQLNTLDGMQAFQHDAKVQMMVPPYDLVVLDFPTCTIRTHGDWPWHTFLQQRPPYVVFADTALRRLGLHRALYSRAFGTPVQSHQDYVEAYSNFLWKAYGYSITREAHHVYSYMRAEPVPPGPITVERV